MRILVTAVGAELGQAVVKALRLSDFPVECYGCDMQEDNAGIAFVTQFFCVPPARNREKYLQALDDICRLLSIDIVVPASEPEIDVLSEVEALPCGSSVLCQPASWINIYGDKLKCMEALAGCVELARFADGADSAAVERLLLSAGYPLVVKPRHGSGSTGVAVVEDDEQLAIALKKIRKPMIQEYIDSKLGEYSVGVFVCEYFQSMICFVRELGQGGASWIAETVHDEEVLGYVHQIATASKAQGSINVQVRKSSRGVRLLEINARFSSLVAARAVGGFRDLDWSIELLMGRVPKKPSEPLRHVRFRRFIHEVIDIGDGYGAVAAWTPRMSV
ncbi:MAG: ATP-grasp domain-containing protein [Verrucomicrobia bacterium]|nr:ATP-grasp domain-containing protein [Verrucomicrobiota bacterium]